MRSKLISSVLLLLAAFAGLVGALTLVSFIAR